MGYPLFEKIMRKAYNKYPKTNDVPFFSVLTPREKEVVALGNLNYQVENGGFTQWVDNGYCSRESTTALFSFLKSLGTVEADKVTKMIRKVCKYVNLDAEHKGCLGGYLKDEGYEPTELFDEFTSQFYKINNILLDSAEEFLSNRSQKTTGDAQK